MTSITRLAVLACVAVASPVVIAQAQAQQSQATWQRMYEMGLEHRTAWDLYQTLKQTAGGGQVSPPFSQLPDWSGLWTSGGGGSLFGGGPGGALPKLTPTAAAVLQQGAALTAKGISYDENLSQCGPPGFPRWLVIPFLREFIVRPEQTWLSSETVNIDWSSSGSSSSSCSTFSSRISPPYPKRCCVLRSLDERKIPSAR